jgi:hypothetical protein
MRLVTTPIYSCDHCGKLYKRKNACISHEPKCSHNPDNRRACFGCEHLEKVKADYYTDHPMGGEIHTEVHVLKCQKLDKYVYPPRVEHNKSAFEFGDKLNGPMPRQCDSFKEDLPF